MDECKPLVRGARYRNRGTRSGRAASGAGGAATNPSPIGKLKSNWGHSAGNSAESVAFAEVAVGTDGY